MEELPQIEKVIQTTYVKENTMNHLRQLGKRSITLTFTAQSPTTQHTPFYVSYSGAGEGGCRPPSTPRYFFFDHPNRKTRQNTHLLTEYIIQFP